MTIDKKLLLLEGLAWHKGMHEALNAHYRFEELYNKKHPNYEAKQRDNTYMRYIIMYANRRKGIW